MGFIMFCSLLIYIMLLSSKKWKRVKWVNGNYLAYFLSFLSVMDSSLKTLTHILLLYLQREKHLWRSRKQFIFDVIDKLKKCIDLCSVLMCFSPLGTASGTGCSSWLESRVPVHCLYALEITWSYKQREWLLIDVLSMQRTMHLFVTEHTTF